MKIRNCLSLASVLFLLTGCITFTYNNQSYRSAEAALAAHDNDLAAYKNQINESTIKIPGTALVVTPTKKTTKALGITTKNSPPPEIIDYLGEYLEKDFSTFAEFLRESQVFDEVVLRIVDFPPVYAKDKINDYAAVIYLHMISPSQKSWYLINSRNEYPQQINFDNLSNTGSERINSWIKDLTSKALETL